MSAADNKTKPAPSTLLPPSQTNPGYTIRVICCVLFIFLTEICLAHYVYRLISSEIRSEYVSKSEFRNNLLNELRAGAGGEELRRIAKEVTSETNRSKRELGDFDYNVVSSPGDEPHVEFFNPKLRGELEARDEIVRKQTGGKGAAPGGDSWIWLSSYSRIPVSGFDACTFYY